MRRHARTRSAVAVEYSLADVVGEARDYLRDISAGGIAFHAAKSLPVGARVHVRIPIDEPAFCVEADVVWCRPADGGFDVGLRFAAEATQAGNRAAQRIGDIEEYRMDLFERAGRRVSSEQAAAEWLAHQRAGDRHGRKRGAE